MKEFHVKESSYISFYKEKEMSDLCKSVKLGSFINKNICKVTCNTLLYSINAGS